MPIFFEPYQDVIVRMLLAALLGGLIGLERDIHGRAAGLRTHLLVSLGAAVFTILSLKIAGNAAGSGFSGDPGRIAAQIVTGIGFLGAGVILKSGINVHGLTTAACLWTTAAIGMAAGAGYSGIALATTTIALIGLIVLKFGERVYRRDTYRTLIVTTDIGVSVSQVIEAVQRKRLKILSCDIEKNYLRKDLMIRLQVRLSHRGITDKLAHEIIDSLEKAPLALRAVKWEHT